MVKLPGDDSWSSMTPIWIDDKQYIMGHSSKKSDGRYKWFIQRMFPSGDFGPITDSGSWSHYYATLITLQRSENGQVFIFGQRDYDDYGAFTMEVLSGGKLAKHNSWSDTWYRYYDAVTPLPNSYHTCFYVHNSHDDNSWCIECITDEGRIGIMTRGNWDHGYQVILSYREDGWSYLFGHRHYRHWYESWKELGPWFIQHISDDSIMKSVTDSGTWDNFYASMTTFYSPEAKKQYIIGHNTDKNYFIQHVSHNGNMDEEIQYGGPWAHYYDHLFPIDFNTSYLHVDNWMERMIDTIGDRTLSEIALPASHDSGMNGDDVHGCSVGGRTCNTQTQYVNIGGQLSLGARYFDIRPMIQPDDNGKDWTTGHATNLKDTNIIAGCRGEDKFSIIDGLNAFFADGKHSKELVILKISHCMSPPGGGYSTCTCSDSQKSEMANNLASHLGDNVVKGKDLNLNSMTLNNILKKGNIILVAEGVEGNSTSGIFEWGSVGKNKYVVYDDYSNTEEFDVMVNGGTNNKGDYEYGQIAKLRIPENHSGDYNGFLLSWTLTLSTYDALKCPYGSPPDILDMAIKTQPRIYEYMAKEVENGNITKTLFPNLLYVDTFNRTTTNAAIYLNKQYESLAD